MDAFVFPSTWEGLGIVAIEAQASGLECYLSRELPKEVEVTDAVTWFDVQPQSDEEWRHHTQFADECYKEISKSVSTSKTTPITSKVLFKNQQ